MTGPQFVWVRETREQLITELRDDALGLVEALGYDDNAIRSAIGSSKGEPYENLFRWVKEYNPLNEAPFQEKVTQRVKQIKIPQQQAKL